MLILTILLALSLVLVACGSATTETAPAREEPEAASEPIAPTEAPEAEPASQASDEAEDAPATEAEAPTPESESEPESEPAPVQQDGAVSFQNDILPIFENSCIRCHGDSRTERGLDLGSYDALMRGSRNGAMLIPGDAQNSELALQVISGEMPRRAPKLADEQIQLIVDWINQGALDN